MTAQKPRILLVEDDIALATAYKLRMEAEGFDVRHCADGEQAMQEALSYRPDLILLDIMMPKISGFDVLDILHNTKETAHTKIIILTALSQPSDRQRAKDLGADEFLVKSQAVIADVMKRIRFHLGLKEAKISD
jgi:DNA-binding response OmpR family regulator